MNNFTNNPKQLKLAIFNETGIRQKINHAAMPAKKATFINGQEETIHRWFRLTPSFGPYLVNHILDNMGCALNDIVLDPFAGAGTTLIECKKKGIESLGFEINPVLHFVCKTSLYWDLEPRE